MAKQLNVSLNFTANTAQAKAQMQELQRQLNSLTGSLTSTDLPITKEIKEAISETAKLEVALKQSMNMDTGKFDLSKFNDTLKKSGTSLQQLSAKLNAVGPEGRRAFMSLAQSIAAAEIPMKRTNTLLNSMWTTMKNTARWQLSSSALHAFTGALHSAVGYAKDLNESLNNIRIVTGDSVDDMAKFAEQANKAAKTLGTTTTRYTNAALIYYQQGLSDQEVQERTNATVKMANVTGENAQDVSSYMTAIWNNFDDGSKSMEYFADVITKLGAETAASSKEIAGGLEKFAAIGETVGLSYEYATAALTTIIDKTRQSEDVVGTALKTIFARIQGLKMGEETEDGLDLNKYSAALAQYGIDIFDANRNLKDMDVILDEMGAKWETLNRAQKVGLAQTVAGVRQYNQLVSLMDNWDAMKQNVQRAESSSGSLDKQAEIYEESWEAASNRVRAALESIYSDLLDDEFLIDIMNGLEKIISFTDQLIDSAGGLKGTLIGISAIVFKLFSSQITTGLQNMVYSLTPMKIKQAQAEKIKQQAIAESHRFTADNSGLSASDSAELTILRNRLSLQELINRKEAELNPLQKAEVERLQKINNMMEEKHLLAQKNAEAAQKELHNYESNLHMQGYTKIDKKNKDLVAYAKTYDKNYMGIPELGRQQLKANLFQTLTTSRNDGGYGMANAAAEKYVNLLTQQIDKSKEAIQSGKNLDETFDKIFADINNMKATPPDYSSIFVSAASAASSLAFGINAISQAFKTLQDEDMEWGDKLSSIAMSLGMTLPGLITGINGLSKARTDLIAKMTLSVAVQEADNTAVAKGIVLNKALAAAKFLTIGKIAAFIAIAALAVKIVDHFTVSQKELSEQFDIYEEAADKVKSLKDELDGVNNSIDELLSKGLSQLTNEEEEQLEVLRKQRIELENQLVLAEQIAKNEQKKFANDFKQKAKQPDLKNEEKQYFNSSEKSYISKAEEQLTKNDNFKSLAFLKSYETDEIEKYRETLEKAYNENDINIYDYETLKEYLDDIETANGELSEDIAEMYKLGKAYLSTEGAENDITAYNEAIAAVERYYSYLGDSVNYKQDLIDLYGVSAEDLTEAQGRYKDLTELEKSSFYDKIEQMSKETGLSVEFLADKLGLLEESAHKLSQSDVFTNFKALLNEGEGKKNSEGKLNPDDILNSQTFDDGKGNSIDLGENNTLQSIFENSGLSVQEQQDILLNIDWEDQTKAESVIQALQQIEELTSDQSMVQEAISLGYSEEQFEAMTAGIMRTNEAFKDNEKLAKQAAIYQMRLSKAIDEGAEIWDDYGDALKEADETNSDYYEGLGALAETFTENLGFEVDWSDIEDNLDLVKKAMEGDADAAAELAQQLAFDSIDTKLDELVESDLINLQTSLKSLGSELPIELQGLMDESVATIQNGWEMAQSYLDNNDLEIGAYVEDTQVYEALNNMIAASGMTKDEAQSYLSSIGYEGEIETHDVVMKGTTVSGEINIGQNGLISIPYSYQQDDTTISVPFIKDASLKKTSTKTGLKNVSSGSQSKSSKSGGSKKDMERYHTVSNQLETLEDQYSAIGSAREQAFGADKLAFYDQEIEKLDQIIEKNKEYLSQIEKNLTSDKAKMESYGAKFDENGDIINYRTIFKKYGQDENFQKALENYEESVDKYREKVEEINEELREWQSLNFERLNYVVELKLDLNEDELQELDYYYNKLGDDVYKSAECFALLKDKMDNTEDSLEIHKQAIADLDAAFAAGEISQADYIEGIREHKDAIYENLEALQEYEKQLKEFYGETLEKAKDELAEYIDQFDVLNNALEHYKNILELTGQEQDFEKMAAILESSAAVAEDKLAISAEWYEVQKQNLADLEAEYARTHDETIKAALDAQRIATAEAYEAMLSDAEEYAKALNDIYQNEVAAAQEALEKLLSGGLGFDRLNASMQHMSDIQDEYLTKTNQIYETNKLLNNLNNDINKTNNIASKQKINAFAKEIEQLQEKDKLSNLELEIAQAKYKQLQVQIALEEAQNAKSIVRLSRDNEGNYGYVYTSDQEAISDAEQELADAENDLYNIRLKGANEYGEKVIQLNQWIAEELAKIDNDATLTQEQRNELKAELLNQYYEKLNMYTDLYGIAQEEDARVVNDAWVNTYSDIILNGEECKNAITVYNEETNESFNNLQNNLATVVELAGTDLTTLQSKVDNVTSASEALRNEINTQVIPALDDELDRVKEQIIQHAKEEKGIENLENAYEKLCKDLQETIKKYTELETAAIEAAAAMAKAANAGSVSSTPGNNNNKGKDLEEGSNLSEVKYDMKQSGYLSNKKDGGEHISVGVNTNNTKTVNGKNYVSYDGKWLLISDLKIVNGTAQGSVYKIPEKGSIPYYSYVAMDTGGYTGEWGPEGKLAMLHEKEIVLNKEDTSNMLKMVEIVRAMIDANVMNSIATNLHSPGVGTQNQNLEQNVTITAEFPNATDHNEIKMAFESLVNKASQYANRIR